MMSAFARLPRKRLNHIILLQLPEGHARHDAPSLINLPKKTRPALRRHRLSAGDLRQRVYQLF